MRRLNSNLKYLCKDLAKALLHAMLPVRCTHDTACAGKTARTNNEQPNSVKKERPCDSSRHLNLPWQRNWRGMTRHRRVSRGKTCIKLKSICWRLCSMFSTSSSTVFHPNFCSFAATLSCLLKHYCRRTKTAEKKKLRRFSSPISYRVSHTLGVCSTTSCPPGDGVAKEEKAVNGRSELVGLQCVHRLLRLFV